MRNYYYDVARTLVGGATLGISAVNEARKMDSPFIGPLNQIKRQKMAQHSGVVNKMAGRAAMKTKGRKNVKGVKGKKPVPMSRKFREKVKQVINSTKIRGRYESTRVGQIGAVHDVATPGFSSSVLTVGPYTSQGMIVTPGSAALSNARYWYAGLPTLDNVTFGHDWNFFTPQKIMDAASILWNNKTISVDYSLTAFNFILPTTAATGAPVGATPAAPNSQGHVIHVRNSYVKWEMKNNSQRTVYLDIYHCVPKVTHPTQLPLETLNDGIAIMLTDATYRQLRVGTTDEMITNPQVEPNTIPAFAATYKYEKITMGLAPGETCTHYLQGPKNYDLEYNKLYPGGQDMTGFLYKKCTVSVMIAVRLDLQYATVGATAAAPRGSGRYMLAAQPDDQIATPVSIETHEVFDLAMPEQSGFYQRAVAAGVSAQLNLQRPCLAFGNFCGNPDTTLIYGKFDEEQPATAVPGSATN